MGGGHETTYSERMTVEQQDSLGCLLLHFGRKPETSQDDGGSGGIRHVSHDDTHTERDDAVSSCGSSSPGWSFVRFDFLQLAVDLRQPDAF